MHKVLLLPVAIFATSLTLALALDGGAAVAQQAAPAGDKAEGYKTYLANGCSQCHGTIGQGAPDRFGPRIAPRPVPYAYFYHQVRNPHNPIQTYTPMPVYTAKVLTDEQVANIYAYLVSIGPAKKVDEIPLLKNLKE